MRVILHVETERDFDLNDLIIDTLGSLSVNFEEHHINAKKIPRRFRRKPHNKNGKTSTGELWTWVTKNGNAIHLSDISDENLGNVIRVELNCRRHVFSDPNNGIEILVEALEDYSGVKRQSWEVIDLHSGLDVEWYTYTENENTAHNRNKEIERVVPKPRIRQHANQIYTETGDVNKYQVINALLSSNFEKDNIDRSEHAITDVINEIKRHDVIKTHMRDFDFSDMETSDIMRELSRYFEKSEMRYVYGEVEKIIHGENV